MVPRHLAEVEGVRRHRVEQPAGHVELEAFGKHLEPDVAPRHRVVPVGYRVDERLEHGPLAVLRDVHAAEPLDRADPHVPAHEPEGGQRLRVERSGDVLRVNLEVGLALVAGVEDRLDERMG